MVNTVSKTPKVSLTDIWNKGGRQCWICRKYCSLPNASRDHVIPISLGGTNSIKNLRLAHKACNAARGNQIGSVLRSDVLKAIQAKQDKMEVAALLFQYRATILWELAKELRERGYTRAAEHVENSASALVPLETVNQEVQDDDEGSDAG